MITDLLSDLSQAQVLHYGFFFTLAALIHASQVRKEIKIQFSGLTTSIDNLTASMAKHSSRLDSVEDDVKVIKEKVGIPFKGG